ALVIQTIDSLKWHLLLSARDEVHGWVREVERAVPSNHDVVRSVEFLPFVVIGENFIFSVRGHFDYRAQHARTIDKPVPAVEGVAIGIAKRDYFFLLSVGIEP